ncbi:MAG: hypothetical protein ACRDI3_04510 [Actinomycetota bacterium]
MARRLLSLLLISLLGGAALGAPAGAGGKSQKRVERTVEASYTPPITTGIFPLYMAVNGFIPGGAVFATGTKDHYIQIEIEDDSGQPTYAGVGGVDDNPAGGVSLSLHFTDDYRTFCSSTDKPIPIPSRWRWVWVQVYQGPCIESMTPALATTGIIRATFSNLP